MPIQINQPAPDFSLPDTEKNKITRSGFHGKNVVVFFFPMAWTSTCTREMCTLEGDFTSYQGLDAVVIGISVDTLYALKRYKEDYHLDSIVLLSDFNKTAIHDFDVVHHDFSNGYKDVAKRATF